MTAVYLVAPWKYRMMKSWLPMKNLIDFPITRSLFTVLKAFKVSRTKNPDRSKKNEEYKY